MISWRAKRSNVMISITDSYIRLLFWLTYLLIYFAYSIYEPSRPTQPGHPSVGALSTGDGLMTTTREGNGEFCVYLLILFLEGRGIYGW